MKRNKEEINIIVILLSRPKQRRVVGGEKLVKRRRREYTLTNSRRGKVLRKLGVDSCKGLSSLGVH